MNRANLQSLHRQLKWYGNRIYIYGAGDIGEFIYQTYCDKVPFAGFITEESDINIPSGSKKVSLDEALQKRGYIIIAENSHLKDIVNKLCKLGLNDDEFCHYKRWMRVCFRRIYEQSGVLLQDYVEFYITDRCSLKCKACSLLLPHIADKNDRPLHDIARDLSAYFSVVDYVSVLRILGGEPFLFGELDQLLQLLGQLYRQHIGKLFVVTNGTVLPTEEQAKLLSTYNIEVLISDYPVKPAKMLRNKLLDYLQKQKVKYSIKHMESWTNIFGNPSIKKHSNEDEIRNLFRNCAYRCRTVYDEKLYFCSTDCAAQRIGVIEGANDDCVSLSDRENIQEQILSLDEGRIAKGYVSFCQNCFGGPDCNRRLIAVGEQML